MTKLKAEAMTRLVTLHQEDVDRDGLTPVFLKTQAGGLTREDTFEGRDHFVVQTVAAISKVMNGELLPADELAMFVEAWNGRPVPLRHPQVNGLHVSANSPEVLEDFNLGFFFNARAEPHDLGVKLVGEMWLDVARINEKGGSALEALITLQNGGTVEVSTAYFCMVRNESGTFDGEEYEGVQHNIKPDHVALLPDQIGACSVADGCGVNTNAETAQEARDGDEDPTPMSNALEPGQRAMVGVWLSREAAAVLALEAEDGLEPVRDLHITLAYLGEGEAVTIDQQSLSGLVDYMTGFLYTHTVQITGTFRFFTGDTDAVGYLVDGETLNRVRQIIVDELRWMDQSVSRPDHWVPHVTLGYTSNADFTVPVPGVGRFGVSALTVAYGDEVISFPLRGEVGSPYLPMNQQTNGDQQMSDEQKTTPCGDVTGNDDGATETGSTPDPKNDAVEAVIPEDMKRFMDEVNAHGGVKAIMDGLATITAANTAKRAGAVEAIKAHTSAYADADLDAMDTEALVQLADVLGSVAGNKTTTPAANFSANGGNADTETHTETPDGMRAFSWGEEDGDK